ncbi:MAG: type IV pilus modification protein PilV [Steroidobacteraceae bacterium]
MRAASVSRLRKDLWGITMVESLVALLVLSVGMLGIAALFVQSVQNGRSALLRTQAVNLVSDMLNRIRANVDAADAYDLAGYGGAPAVQACQDTFAVAGANCDPATLAEDDLARWLQTVQTLLPGGAAGAPTGNVEYFAPPAAAQPERYRVTVTWQEPGVANPLTFAAELLIVPRPPA